MKECYGYSYFYPASSGPRGAVLILKGLYGVHNPLGNSWDNKLVQRLQAEHDVLCLTSGRRDASEEVKQFEGKTFQQECSDLRSAYGLARGRHLKPGKPLGVIAASFGGTLLLGCPEIVRELDSLVMVGSGCGKSVTTTRPLLSTLPERAALLGNLRDFTGAFVLVRGSKDAVVPELSQAAIYQAAGNARSRAWAEYRDLDHRLSQSNQSRLAEIAWSHFVQTTGHWTAVVDEGWISRLSRASGWGAQR